MNRLNETYWKERYIQDNTPWDIGYVSPPLKSLIDSIEDKETSILIPGAGRAYEAIYLHQMGFQQIYVCDWVEEAFHNLWKNVPDFPKDHCLIGDFFELETKFDLIIEQTFFCAINPTSRQKYAQKAADLLNENGILGGLLFGVEFQRQGPPFGGTKEEYIRIFEPFFEILTIDIAQNSISPRQGNELFFKFKRL